MIKNLNSAIGEQLKRARATNGWSLDKTCQHTGVSKAMLGQIERAESSPTIATLWKIASGFDLPLSYFLVVISDNTSTENALKTDQGISASTLFPFDATTGIEVFALTLMPLHQHISFPHNDGVVEHILVVEGEMEYLLDGQWKPLNIGEVVKFNADTEHGYRNMTETKSIFHNIICYTGKR